MISTPYIAVPPKAYGGTELIVHLLTEGLVQRGHDVALYATGDSKTTAELYALYQKSLWPPKNNFLNPAKELNHASWAVRAAIDSGAEVIHMHCTLGVALERFTSIPIVYTIHHPFDKEYSDYYSSCLRTNYVAISDFQRQKLAGIKKIKTIHHGINLSDYTFHEEKENYLLFLGRIAAVKGPQLAIAAAKLAKMPLKIAGDIQPIHQDFYETAVKPSIDGKLIEYVGEADHKTKVDLLKKAKALLFPIQWDEPFGLVMIESMACGTPVLAFPFGSVPEIVKPGQSGFIVDDVEQMADKISELHKLPPRRVREYAERYFTADRMIDQYEAEYRLAIANQTARTLRKSANASGDGS